MRLILCLLLSLATTPLFAQTLIPALTRGGDAYLWGKPEQIAAADVSEIAPSPNGRYLLFLRHTPASESFADSLPAQSQTPQTMLCLYDAKRKQTVILWKITEGSVDSRSGESVTWLADGETAIVVASRCDRYPEGTFSDDTGGVRRYTTELLFVDVPRQKIKTVSLGSRPTAPFMVTVYPAPIGTAAIVHSESFDLPMSTELRFVQGIGTVVALPIKGDIAPGGWNATGTTWAAREYSETADRKAPKTYAVFDRAKTVLLSHQLEPRDEHAKRPLAPALPQSFARLQTVAGTWSAEGKVEPVSRLVVDMGDPAEKIVLATNAEAVCVMGGDSPVVVYGANDALFAVPSYRVSHSDYVRRMRRRVTAGVMQIDSAMEQWMMDNKSDTFPKSPDAVSLLVGDGKSLYLKRNTPFRDPRTGAFAFQNLFTGSPDATGKTPRFSLQTSFGKVTMYAGDSPPVWEPAEPPTTKPTPPAKP